MVEIVALFLWVRDDVPGFTKVSKVQKMPQSFAAASVDSAEVEVRLLVSTGAHGSWAAQ